LDWTAIDPDKLFAYPQIIKLLNDPRMLRDPTVYFRLSDKIVNQKKTWIKDSEVADIQNFISNYIVFQE
jgi:hypothetical protein